MHGATFGQRWIAILEAYLDESGTHQDALLFVLAGYVAPEEVWRKVETKWQEMLDAIPMPEAHQYFHAHDLEPPLGQKQFRRHLDQNQRDDIKRKAVNIAVGSGIIGAAICVHIYPYEQILRPVLNEDPYLFAMKCMVSEFHHESKKFIGESNTEIGFWFDNQQKWELEAHRQYAELRAAPNLPYNKRMGTVAFGNKKKFLPLQVADHLAYKSYRNSLAKLENPASLNRPAMNRLCGAWNQSNGRVYNEAGCNILLQQMKEDGLA